MISPTTIEPMIEPTKAPTIPPQKRSGRKIVKAQIAKPMSTQPSIPISTQPLCGSSRRPSASPVFAVARAPGAFRLGLVLHHQVLRREIGSRAVRRLIWLLLLRAGFFVGVVAGWG